MTHVSFTATGLQVHFPGWEAAMTRRHTFSVAPEAIISAHAEEGWSSQILGFRSGLAISGFRKVGIFRHPSGVKRLVSMKRGLPLLRVAVDRAATGFDELLLSTAEAPALAEAIRAQPRP